MSRKKLNPSESDLRQSVNDWVTEILGANQPEKVPKGWIDLETLAKQAGLPSRTATHRVNRLIEEGKLQRKQFRVKVGGRSVSAVWHYAPVTKRKKP
jgi:hypothetical protein